MLIWWVTFVFTFKKWSLYFQRIWKRQFHVFNIFFLKCWKCFKMKMRWLSYNYGQFRGMDCVRSCDYKKNALFLIMLLLLCSILYKYHNSFFFFFVLLKNCKVGQSHWVYAIACNCSVVRDICINCWKTQKSFDWLLLDKLFIVLGIKKKLLTVFDS